MVYESHNRFLPINHHLRGRDQRPIPNTVANWKRAWDNGDGTSLSRMMGVSTFYTLPYWGELLIHHLLDPMHCFKNIAVAIWQHICGHKDSYNCRVDLKEVHVMHQCWPQENVHLPNAPWILTKEEKSMVKKAIKTICTPTGTMHYLKGVFSTSAKERELSGLKTHDWHKMLRV